MKKGLGADGRGGQFWMPYSTGKHTTDTLIL
ncbi:hypothetical protein A5886_001441 [Enterococcus sp. 8G7_MSG3316]|uniref:Uncharacterized protein n=1 Tax=Candidatus Enterococcus testudinis TaxID=1834191 RepID=A0A242A5R2_9ENTE|nr:hypothetical protein A5886_001441 [Enterococcus sp. 8G7_MSG3316]